MPADVIQFGSGEYRVIACLNAPPPARANYREHARVVEEFDLKAPEGRYCFLAVARSGVDWPSLVVEQRYAPSSESGFYPGALLVPESHILFVGAGTRLLAYQLHDTPRRLWEDYAQCGFWSWARIDDVVLMSAELEFAAWSADGVKLWSTFVEPPWSYSVAEDQVHLDVMGTRSSFSLARGPGLSG
jgi:hypothetical protein